MSKVVQGMLGDHVDALSNGSVGKSHSGRLKIAYPDSTSNPKNKFSSAEIPLTKEDYRDYYETSVLRFNGFSDEFGETVNLSYDAAAPDLRQLVTPEGEESQGKDGSTIVSAGIGPNVNPFTLNKEKEVIMVDPTFVDNHGIRISSPPFVGNGSMSPSESSSKLSTTTLGELIVGVSRSSEGGS